MKRTEEGGQNEADLEAMLHLLARYLEMRPLFLCLALPMKEEWKMSPYLGVLPLVFRALKRAFSAPKICTVDAGYLAKFVKEPATLCKTTSVANLYLLKNSIKPKRKLGLLGRQLCTLDATDLFCMMCMAAQNTVVA